MEWKNVGPLQSKNEYEKNKTGQRNYGMRGRTYGGQYTYYKRLRTDGYGDLYKHVRGRLDMFYDRNSNFQKIGIYFIQAAEEEKKKELALLKKIFGYHLSGTYADKDFAKKLIQAINFLMNFSDILNQNLSLIKDTKGQSPVFTHFGKYFCQEWEKQSKTMEAQLETEVAKTGDLDKAIDTVIDRNLLFIIQTTLRHIFLEIDGPAGIKKEQWHAYEQIVKEIEKNSNIGNEFLNSFVKTYHLDEISNAIKKELKSKPNKKNILRISASLKEEISNQRSIKKRKQKGGNIFEHIITLTQQMIGEQLHGQNSSITYHAVHTGTKGNMKADIMAYASINPDGGDKILEDWLKESKFGGRVKNTKAMGDLQKKLQEENLNGFIIYTSAKQYTINENFKDKYGGFSAGKPVNLLNLGSMFKNLDVNMNNLITTLMQLPKGAIGEGTENDISAALARLIGSAMFDDVNEIGRHNVNQAQSIHLLDLNGILTPLSLYFDLLGTAFLKVGSMRDMSDLIQVKIEHPSSIEFPYSTDQYRWMALHPNEDPWDYQASISMKNTTVAYTFLGDFKKIITQLFS